MPNLPIDGQTGWGDILNAYLNTLQTQANTTQGNLAGHSANTPADPHGDRSYAQGLVSPIINGVNLPNGFVQLNSQGLIPSSLISGGGGNNVTGGAYTGIYDAVATFGAVSNNGADQTTAIQNALNAAATAPAGGVVWLGPGVFSMSGYLVMPGNTHLMMSEGTTLKRISGSPNAPYMITNVKFGTSNTPASGIRISGGKLDAVGSGLSSDCTPIFLIQSAKNNIDNIYINGVFDSPAIEINGCSHTIIQNCLFDGTGSNNFFTQSGTPAVRVNVSASSTTPSGLSNTFYNNTVSYDTRLVNSATVATGFSNGCYGALIGDDFSNSHHSQNLIVMGCTTAYSSALGSAIFTNGQFSGTVNTGNLFV